MLLSPFVLQVWTYFAYSIIHYVLDLSSSQRIFFWGGEGVLNKTGFMFGQKMLYLRYIYNYFKGELI